MDDEEIKYQIERTSYGLRCDEFHIRFMSDGSSLNFSDYSLLPHAECWWNEEELDAVMALLIEAKRLMQQRKQDNAV